MLTNSFRHIPGIGLKTEKRLWASGIKSWDDFSSHNSISLSPKIRSQIQDYINKSKQHLTNNPLFFTNLLNTNQQWRIFPHYRFSTAYIDIETTGLNEFSNHITTIALYDGAQIKYYVYDDNISDFIDDIHQYDVIVPFNGKCFDIPFIERFFNISIKKANIDLRFVLSGLGISGGLKKCENKLGIHRGDLDGIDGSFAVYLWHEYITNSNKNALDTLLAYNIEDVVNLEQLMIIAYNLNLLKTPFEHNLKIPTPIKPISPFTPDLNVIDSIKTKYKSRYYV